MIYFLVGPDCNDGFGSSDPCRPGEPGSGYYYKCIRIGNSYTYVRRRCFWKCLDVCYRNPVICQ